MNRNYDEIMELIGADELKELIGKWDVLSANIKNNACKMPRLLPNLLWVGNSGIGRTKLMSLMSADLASKGNLLGEVLDAKRPWPFRNLAMKEAIVPEHVLRHIRMKQRSSV